MTPLPMQIPVGDCWNTIGIRGDRSCVELLKHVQCQNCPVFADAGRRFLDARSPEGYLDEWTERLAAPVAESATDLTSLLVFRLADEWLALPVHVLIEVATPRPVHRVPNRGGLLAGLVNIRGELYLCGNLAKLLGIAPSEAQDAKAARLLVARRDSERWVLPVDAVDQVIRVSRGELRSPPATVGRAQTHLTCGVLVQGERAIGLLDDARLFESLRARLQ